jgi:short-subunit dehydrogenase
MVVLITGTSSGLGKALAELLATKGYKIWGTMRKLPPHLQFNYKVIEMDVCNHDSIREGIAQIIQKEGKIDYLINNAGVGLAAPLELAGWEKIQVLYQTNVFGLVQTIQEVLPFMRKSGFGRIINISSIGSEVSLPFRGLYCSTKSAVNRITESLRMEVRDFNFQATSILAGDMATSINENRLTEIHRVDEIYQEDFGKVHKHINSEVEKGVTPEIAARQIFKIIQKEKWSSDYAIGHRMQKISLLLRRFLPKKWFEKIIFQYSGL